VRLPCHRFALALSIVSGASSVSAVTIATTRHFDFVTPRSDRSVEARVRWGFDDR
jgi:hypothetical protein